MKFFAFAICFLIAVPLIGRALDYELARADASKGHNSQAFRSASPGVLSDSRFIPTSGVLSERVTERSSSASGGQARLVGTRSESTISLTATHHQGRPLRWWVAKSRQNKKDANARGRTIRRLQSAARRQLTYPTGHWLDGAFLCIHRYERGAAGWRTLTGNGFSGGLQMNAGFQRTYGPAWARRAFGESAHLWPASVQITAAIRAWTTRGFGPWPATRRMCGL